MQIGRQLLGRDAGVRILVAFVFFRVLAVLARRGAAGGARGLGRIGFVASGVVVGDDAGGAAVVGGLAGAGVFTGIAATVDVCTGVLSIAVVAAIAATAASAMAKTLRRM